MEPCPRWWNPTITVKSAANQTGTTTITVTVSDGANTASTSLVLTVLPNTGFDAWKSSDPFEFWDQSADQTWKAPEIDPGGGRPVVRKPP